MPATMRPGDWICDSCGNHNFASRNCCNKCQAPRADGGVGVGGGSKPSSSFGPSPKNFGVVSSMPGPYSRPAASGSKGMPEMKEGDWICPSCNNHNFASRVECNKCGTVREGMKAGDWVCRSCKNHNFANRVECKKCGAPKHMSQGGGSSGSMGMVQGPNMMQMMQMMQTMMMGGQGQRVGGGGGFPAAAPRPKNMKEGDWICTECSNHNFASRVNCNKCNAIRPGFKAGDWICGSCRAHNFASKEACFKCAAPKP